MEPAAFHHQVDRLANAARGVASEIAATLVELQRVSDLHDRRENPTHDFLDLKRDALATAISQMEQVRLSLQHLKDGLVAIV